MLPNKRLVLALTLVCACSTSFAQLQIVSQTNAQNLAQKLVGDGVTISNVTLNANSLATGFFYNLGGTQIGLDSGIVLSSGRILTSGFNYGLNGSAGVNASNSLSWPGDAQLSAQVNGQTTFDAAILEFDFVPLGDTVQFRYVFSSEEYPDFNCSNYNDVFAFFISGPGITGAQNIALVPGTTIPVAINSINNGVPGLGGSIGTCNGMGPGSPFTTLYVNNASNPIFTHDGHTRVLTAQSLVQPCQVYHLKIAISDAFDAIYDSGVFLEAKSLKSDPIKIVSSTPLYNGLSFLVEGCNTGGVKILRSRKTPYPQTVNLAFAGVAANGVDVQLIPTTATIPANDSIGFVPLIPLVDNIAEGSEIIRIYVSNGCNLTNSFYLDSVDIEIRDYDTLSLVPRDTVLMCRGNPQQLTASASYTSYQWTPATGLSNASIANPIAAPATGMTTYLVTASLVDCHARDSVKIKVKELELLSKKDINCKNGTTGEIKVSGGWEFKQPVQYNINNTAYTNDSTFTNLGVGSHVVRIKDASGCIDSMVVNLQQAFPDLLVVDSIVTAACNGSNGQIILSGAGGNQVYSYTIDNGAYTSTTGYTVPSGNHTVSIKDTNGCVTTRPVVVATDLPITFTITPDANACNGSSTAVLTVVPTGGSGTYQYAQDGVTFQTANTITISTTTVQVTVKDNKGCSAVQSINIPLGQAIFVDPGNDVTICEGDQFHIPTTSNAATFTWIAQPSLSSTSIADPVANPVVTTMYYVTAVKDVCTVKDSIKVFVNPAPIAFAGPDSVICYGKTIQLTGSGGTSYSWSPAAGIVNSSSQFPTVRPTQTLNYYWLTVRDANGCYSLKADSVKVTLTPAVQAFAGRDTIVAMNQPMQMNGYDLGNSGVTMYNWSPATGLSNPNIQNPILTTDHDMLFTLTLTTPDGCEGSDQILVKAYNGPEIYVPTGFTPDGDGRNDLLRPIVIGMKTFHYFKVYNRWGQLVYSSVTERSGWDGTISGAKQDTGTYVWIVEMIDFKGNTIMRRGVSTLIR
jgi:gliding motility-associated-like protein